jgi:hypothetical protein
LDALLAQKSPVSPHIPGLVSSFLRSIGFPSENVVQATLDVEYFMDHQGYSEVGVLVSWLNLTRVTRD